MQETWVQSLGREDPLEEEMATCSSVLAWEIPWTKEPGGLQSIVLQRVGYDLATKQQQFKILLWSITDRPKIRIYSSISSILFVVIVFESVDINTG